MSNQIGLRLTIVKKVVLGTAAMAAVTVPIAVGMLGAPAGHAQSAAQTARANPKFDVLDRICKNCHHINGGGDLWKQR